MNKKINIMNDNFIKLKYSLSGDFQGSVFKKLEQHWSETLTKCNNFNEKYKKFQCNLNNLKKKCLCYKSLNCIPYKKENLFGKVML